MDSVLIHRATWEIDRLKCSERRDLILFDAAGQLDPAEQAELRAHLTTGCAECAGYVAEAAATVGMIGLSLPPQTPRPEARARLMNRVGRKNKDWERFVIPSSIAAILAVGLTLMVVKEFAKPPPEPTTNPQLMAIISAQDAQIKKLQASIDHMMFASLQGDLQPGAQGRAFIDLKAGKWYFFTSGMKPQDPGKTYELWLIAGDQKIPAGTFDVSTGGTATLLGQVPALPPNAKLQMCITDEPAGGVPAPTGKAQMMGEVD
jgi:anti-sigma-K factor RskA